MSRNAKRLGVLVKNQNRQVRGMRRIVVSEFVSLDGVMQAPGGPSEDTSGGFKHGGWIFKFRDDRDPKYKLDELFASGALLLGRKTLSLIHI